MYVYGQYLHLRKHHIFMIIYLDLYSDSYALCPLACRLGDIIRIINDDKYFNFFFFKGLNDKTLYGGLTQS